jgi:hypothetical protein
MEMSSILAGRKRFLTHYGLCIHSFIQYIKDTLGLAHPYIIAYVRP